MTNQPFNQKSSFVQTIEKAWDFACSGKLQELEMMLDNYDYNFINWRYKKFGKSHSIIMGAFRNGNFDIVEMLIDEGGKITSDEVSEIESYINTKRVDIMERLIAELILSEIERNNDYIHDLMENLNKYSNIIRSTKN